MEHLATIIVAGQYAAALAVFAGMLTTLGQGSIASKAIESVARQPEARGSISTSMIIGLAMAETNGIYGLVVSMLLLFANPLVDRFVNIAIQLGLS
ncbi:MAG: ATP synthase F0 subunit C [Oscillospiraceae bacterium]|jgi:F-type H+-transporting ATPase subunit c|nr:ATP synthase F0 subunit C [Oscillospiraceae bacterium]